MINLFFDFYKVAKNKKAYIMRNIEHHHSLKRFSMLSNLIHTYLTDLSTKKIENERKKTC